VYEIIVYTLYNCYMFW